MINQPGRIAVIPARGGSKRIPRKNVKLFAGKPMISYAIRTALESRLFDHVVVSTDDDEIAEVARKCGAEVPFIRPRELADDDTATVPVIVHAINSCNDLGMDFDTVCCVYPCVPFLQVQDLVESSQLFTSSDAQFCVPIVEFSTPIQRALIMNSHGMVDTFFPGNESSRTQDLIVTYHDAGQFYWGSSKAWSANTSIHGNAVGFPIPSWRTVDIDTPDDWLRAEIYWDQAKARLVV
jgi:pseudaminic acid cytidylyltransferase